jgi:mannose-6-phosphate isomerase-like protein (cupin superfamily)
MIPVISPLQAAVALTECWSPRILGEIDDAYLKVARLKGTLCWHAHAEEDELFLVLQGHLRIELEDGVLELAEGDLTVIPKGVHHNPVAQEECLVLLLERKSTRHTGDEVTERTRSVEEQLRPL